MTITLTGINDFARQQVLTELIAEFIREQGDLALEQLDGEEADFAKLQASLQSLPFLSSKMMIVLKNGSASKQFVEAAKKLLAELPSTTELIIVEPKLDKRSSYHTLLKKVTDFREFQPLDGEGLVKWLVATAKENHGNISLQDARFLIDRVGSNQQLLSSEIGKLLLYEPTVSRANIELLTESTPQSTIFAMLDAAFSGNVERTINLYNEQRVMGAEPPQIIAMLAWQLHILVLIKAANQKSIEQIAKQASISPFVLRKGVNIARGLGMSELQKLVTTLLELDIKLKTATIDADEALQYYLLSLSKV